MMRLGALLLLTLLTWGPAQAAFPDRPIRLLVPFPPGGTVDIVTRLVAAKAAETLKGTIVIDNRAGAGGTLATEMTAKAAPDGYTIMMTTPNHTINPALYKTLPFDSEKDVMPVALVANAPELLVAHPSVTFTDFAGFVAYAKANPNALNYASAGNGTLPHLSMELLARRLGIALTHVPYRGAAPAMNDLLSGAVQLKFDTYTTAGAHIAAGKLKPLAMASLERAKSMPDLASIHELGVKEFEGNLWMGIIAPARTPADIVAALSDAFVTGVKAPDVVERLTKEGVEILGTGPAEFAAVLAKEMPLYRDLVQAIGVKID